MQIKNHRLVGATYTPSKHRGGKIEPRLIVLHDTAGRLKSGSSVNWLVDNPGKASAHFVIERDGEITQLVPTNRRANHAGRSHYHGADWCNGFSIGIEIVNPGKMIGDGGGNARAWWGQKFDLDEFEIKAASTPEHGSGMWMGYTEEQIAAVIALCASLFATYDGLQDIRGHWYVSPGRKVDPSPLFPMEQVRNLVMGREELSDIKPTEAEGSFSTVSVRTGGERLNMRRWPSFNPNVIAQIPNATFLEVVAEAEVSGRKWLQVEYGGQRGWIVDRYTIGVMK